MLGTKLRYLQASVAHVHNILAHAFNLIAEDNGDALLIGVRHVCAVNILSQRQGQFFRQVLQLDAMLNLLYAPYRVALRTQRTDTVGSILEVLPCHAILTSESRLMDFVARRRGSDATKTHLAHAESITRTEHTAHILCRTHIIQNHRCLELVDRQAVHLYSPKLVHFPLPYKLTHSPLSASPWQASHWSA